MIQNISSNSNRTNARIEALKIEFCIVKEWIQVSLQHMEDDT